MGRVLPRPEDLQAELDRLRIREGRVLAIARKSHVHSADGPWPSCPGCAIERLYREGEGDG